MITLRHTMFTALVVCSLNATMARGHFVWVKVAGEPPARRVELYFSETASPGSAHLVDRVLSATAWIECADTGWRKLDLKPWRDDLTNVGGLAADLNRAGPCRVEVDFPYGVFQRDDHAVLLHYYAKAIHECQASQLERFGRAQRLALDIVPSVDGARAGLTIRFRGEPVPGCRVMIETPDGTKQELKAGASGSVAVPPELLQGCTVRAMHTVDRTGSLRGDAYQAELHVATLTIGTSSTEKVAPEISATELLQQARAARAVWKDFPGFSATLSVHVDSRQETGTIVVDQHGDATLNGFGPLADGFVRQQIDSLIMHRLPGSAFDEGAVYEEESGRHVMGRRVRLKEERMGSVYRIRDDVITEVNRTMGKQHFTISVLDVFRNAEGEYLPHVFTVSFWDNESGALNATHTYMQQWVRVGGYDLPQRLLIVSCDKKGRRVTRLDFSDHALATSSQPTTAPK